MLRGYGISAPLSGQEFTLNIPLEEIESVEIEEHFDADEGGGQGSLKLDLISKIEHFTSSTYSDMFNTEYKAERNLANGTIRILRDEECESEPEEEWDDENWEDEEWDDEDDE